MKHAREDYNRIQDPEGRIGEDEPVFLFRAQDEFFVEVLEFYAARVQAKYPDSLIPATTLKHARRGEQWGYKKRPDLVGE